MTVHDLPELSGTLEGISAVSLAVDISLKMLEPVKEVKRCLTLIIENTTTSILRFRWYFRTVLESSLSELMPPAIFAAFA